jgi:hypothetical protein
MFTLASAEDGQQSPLVPVREQLLCRSTSRPARWLLLRWAGPEGEVGDEDSCSGEAVVLPRLVLRLLLGDSTSAAAPPLVVAGVAKQASGWWGVRP